jgi:hypothetical protein
MGREVRKIFSTQLKEAVESPGPGSYHVIGEFGSYENP